MITALRAQVELKFPALPAFRTRCSLRMKRFSFFGSLSVVATLLALLVTLLGGVSCRSANTTVERTAAYQSALKARSKITLQPGSAAERRAITAYQSYFETVTPESVKRRTREVYSADAFLDDTLKILKGAGEIEAYLEETARSVTEFKVRFQDVARSGPDYYFRWEMDFATEALRDGERIRTVGITQVRFNAEGQVCLHKDFWDPSAGVYDHVPAVGGLIQMIKNRL
jgi:hypothetical protein